MLNIRLLRKCASRNYIRNSKEKIEKNKENKIIKAKQKIRMNKNNNNKNNKPTIYSKRRP